MNFAICYNTFIPLRAEPSEKSEMVSQVLFGEQVEILKIDKISGFAHIKNLFDNYEGWCNNSSLYPLAENSLESLKRKKTRITTEILTSLVAEDGQNCLYLGAGSTVFLNENGYTEVKGVLYSLPSSLNLSEAYNEPGKIPLSAKKFINIPYLWGGRSSFGTDCSGFVQNVFKQAGITLPRDARQQADCGKIISFVDEALPGDLMFFDNKEGIITHTGIYLGSKQIIHASGKVKIDSIDHQGIFSKEEGRYTHGLRVIRRIGESVKRKV